MKSDENRVDASSLTEKERSLIPDLVHMLRGKTHPRLKDTHGKEIPLPKPIHDLLRSILENLCQGRTMVLLPEDETFITQVAAHFLGMSRQHFIDLLENDQISFHKVGTHRRVYFKDLRHYLSVRDHERRTSMKGLFQKTKKAGLYRGEYKGDAR